MSWIADKICAILERHDGHPSTRFKDLVNLVAISGRATVEADSSTCSGSSTAAAVSTISSA